MQSEQIWPALVHLNWAPKSNWWNYISINFFMFVYLAAVYLRREKFIWRFLPWAKNWTTSLLEIVCLQWNHGYEIVANIAKCFVESALSITQVFGWYKAFSESRKIIENLPQASRTSISVNDNNIEKLKNQCLQIVVLKNLIISYVSTQLNARIVLNDLSQKRRRVENAKEKHQA